MRTSHVLVHIASNTEQILLIDLNRLRRIVICLGLVGLIGVSTASATLAQSAKAPDPTEPTPQASLGAPQPATPSKPAPHRARVSAALAFKCFLVGFDNKQRLNDCMKGKLK
jgi:hypothetical protein